jgi:hypothetical protein
MNSAITAWALNLSAGHPTRRGTIDEFLNGCDFLVNIGCQWRDIATPESAGSASSPGPRPAGAFDPGKHRCGFADPPSAADQHAARGASVIARPGAGLAARAWWVRQ